MPYNCDRCGDSTTDHNFEHTVSHMFWCHLCKKDNKDYESFRMHIMKRHRPNSSYYVSIDNEVKENDEDQVNEDKKCKYCLRKFKSVILYMDHKCVKISNNRCTICYKNFLAESDLKHHVFSNHIKCLDHKQTSKAKKIELEKTCNLQQKNDISHVEHNKDIFTESESIDTVTAQKSEIDHSLLENQQSTNADNTSIETRGSDYYSMMFHRVSAYCRKLEFPLPERMLHKMLLMKQMIAMDLENANSVEDKEYVKKAQEVVENAIAKNEQH